LSAALVSFTVSFHDTLLCAYDEPTPELWPQFEKFVRFLKSFVHISDMFRTRERPTRSIRDASVRIDDSREERRNAVTRLRRDIQEADSAKRRAMDDVLELAEEGLPFRDDAEIGAALDSIAADVETFMQRYNAVPVETHGDLIRLIQLPAWTVETSKDLLALIPRLRSLFRTRSCDLSRVIQTNVVPLFLAVSSLDLSMNQAEYYYLPQTKAGHHSFRPPEIRVAHDG